MLAWETYRFVSKLSDVFHQPHLVFDDQNRLYLPHLEKRSSHNRAAVLLAPAGASGNLIFGCIVR
jgi:hypothetical protein